MFAVQVKSLYRSLMNCFKGIACQTSLHISDSLSIQFEMKVFHKIASNFGTT